MGIDCEMYAEVSDKVTPEDVLRVSRRMVECLGKEIFWLRDNNDDYLHAILAKGQTLPHALYITTEETWDSNENGGIVKLPKGKRFVHVSTFTRYYGKGYERGPIHLQMEVARFLKASFKGCKVFYGGDSSGVPFEEVTDEWMADIMAHYYTVAHEPYHGSFDSHLSRQDSIKRPPDCHRCLCKLIRNGFSGKEETTFGSFYCPSCDANVETHDNGTTYVDINKQKAQAREEFWNKLKGYPELDKLARTANPIF